jgi:hypothetical protein
LEEKLAANVVKNYSWLTKASRYRKTGIKRLWAQKSAEGYASM